MAPRAPIKAFTHFYCSRLIFVQIRLEAQRKADISVLLQSPFFCPQHSLHFPLLPLNCYNCSQKYIILYLRYCLYWDNELVSIFPFGVRMVKGGVIWWSQDCVAIVSLGCGTLRSPVPFLCVYFCNSAVCRMRGIFDLCATCVSAPSARWPESRGAPGAGEHPPQKTGAAAGHTSKTSGSLFSHFL